MLRDYILGNIPAWAVGLFASITAQDWNTLILPVIVSAISAVSFAYRAAANREERRVHKHEAHMRKCEAIRAQMLICRDCISGALPVDNCNFEHRPTRCPAGFFTSSKGASAGAAPIAGAFTSSKGAAIGGADVPLTNIKEAKRTLPTPPNSPKQNFSNNQ